MLTAIHANVLLNLVVASVAISIIITIYEMMNGRLRKALHNERAQYEYLAGHDALTHLPNRRSFTDQLDQATRRARRATSSAAVLLLDLNGFKCWSRWGEGCGLSCAPPTRSRDSGATSSRS